MTVLEDLVAAASRPPAADDLDYLRCLTLTNLAAAAGEKGSSQAVLDRLPFGESAPTTAYRLGMAFHARTQDDFFPYGRVHVGAVALPVILSLADRAESGFLEALTAGYRAMCLVSEAYADDAQGSGLRPSGVFGPIAAGITAAKLLDFDAEQTANTAALAAARSGGTNQSWIAGTDEWLLEVGAASRAGVEAALLTEAGVKGAPEALDGDAGWSRAFFGDPGAAKLAESLSLDRPSIARVATKPYPVSGIAQVPTALACQAHADLDGALPRQVELRMSVSELDYPGTKNQGPFASRSSALMSAAWCVACGLTDGAVRLSRLEAPNQLIEAVRLVHPVGDPAMEEGEAAIVLRGDQGDQELHALADQVLYPDWGEMGGDLEQIAVRSEADGDIVRGIYDELRSEQPSATRLHALIQD